MIHTSRVALAATLCLVLSACSGSDPTGDAADPLPAPVEPESTSSQPVVATEPPPVFDIEWSTVDVEFGVSEITQLGPDLVGLAVQDFDAPSSLIEEGDSGCVGFQAGRTGEVVWSADGLAWEPLSAQPYWYVGVLTPEEWAAIIRNGGIPSTLAVVDLVTHGERLLAVSFDELTETQGSGVVDMYEPSTGQWDRLGSLGSIGVNRSAVTAASGPLGTVIIATDPERGIAVWTVTEADLKELSDPLAGLSMAPDESWSAQVDGIEMIAITDGFIAQFEITSRGPVMVYSVDGTQWTRVAHPGAGPVRLAASGTTVIGWNGDGVWISLDHGESWQEVQLEQTTPFIDLVGTPTGFTGWMLEESWVSPAVWFSPDGFEWRPVLELSEEHNWINGLFMTDEAILVSASLPSDGWVCPEIEHYGYEISFGVVTDIPTG